MQRPIWSEPHGVFTNHRLCFVLLVAVLQIGVEHVTGCHRLWADNASTDPDSISPEEFLFQRDRLNNLVFRVGEHRELQRDISRAVDGLRLGHVAKSLNLLQGVLNREMDSGFLLSGGLRQLSVRQEVSHLLGSLPPAARRTYEQIYGEQAGELLLEARQSHHPARFAEVTRRFFHTRAGFAAVDWEASRWLDHGRYAMAARQWARLFSDPIHQKRVTDVLILKAAIANQRCGNNAATLKLMKRLGNRRVFVRGKQIMPERIMAGVAPNSIAGSGYERMENAAGQ